MAEETDQPLDATAANAPTDGDAVKDRSQKSKKNLNLILR